MTETVEESNENNYIGFLEQYEFQQFINETWVQQLRVSYIYHGHSKTLQWPKYQSQLNQEGVKETQYYVKKGE